MSAIGILEIVAKAVHSDRSDDSVRHILRELLNEPTMESARRDDAPTKDFEMHRCVPCRLAEHASHRPHTVYQCQGTCSCMITKRDE